VAKQAHRSDPMGVMKAHRDAKAAARALDDVAEPAAKEAVEGASNALAKVAAALGVGVAVAGGAAVVAGSQSGGAAVVAGSQSGGGGASGGGYTQGACAPGEVQTGTNPNGSPMCAPAPTGSGGAGGAGGGGAAVSGACNFTPRSLRRKLRDMAVEISGESNGSKALRTLRGGDDSWIRDSFVKLYRVRLDRGQARAAVEEIKSQYGVELGCVEPAAAGPGDMQTSLSAADAGMDTELSLDPSMAPGMDPELQTPVAPTSASS